jgi:methionine-gamma-lyase
LLLLLFLQVVYPGLPSHRQYEVLKRLLNPGYGAGGLLGLDMGNPAKAEAVRFLGP